VDALSRDGRRLYLIQYQQSGDYHVRLYDAATGLAAEAITDPSEPGAMTGLPWSSIGSRDGHWQLTLYLEAQGTRTGAFVHALSLTGAEARCIDLPGGDFLAAGRYALTLAPDGHTLYAANPSLGVIAVIDLARHAVHKIVHFPAAAADTSTSTAFGAISPNGKTLYFSAGSGVLAFDTHSTASRGPYKLGDVRGLGFSPSGRSLLVVKADGSTVQLNPKNGTPIKR
jgi:hypothetical protein